MMFALEAGSGVDALALSPAEGRHLEVRQHCQFDLGEVSALGKTFAEERDDERGKENATAAIAFGSHGSTSEVHR